MKNNNKANLFFFFSISIGIFGFYCHARSVSNLLSETRALRKQVQELQEETAKSRDMHLPSINTGRLTLTSGTPVTTSDVTGASTVYFTPYNGTNIYLYSGSAWALYEFSELSLTLSSLTADKNYDVFIYNNSGTLTLELSAAWSTDTARTDTLALVNGVYVKNSATTRRLLGTIRTTSTSTTEDSASKRYVWNIRNRVPRYLEVRDSTASWAHSANGFVKANDTTNNQVQIVTGIAEEGIWMKDSGTFKTVNGANYLVSVSIGADTTTASTSRFALLNVDSAAGSYKSVHSFLTRTAPAAGYHYYQWMNYSNVGDANAVWQSASLYGGIYGFSTR